MVLSFFYLPYYYYYYYYYDIFIFIFSEYVKITDGNGSLVWQYEYPYSPVLPYFVRAGFGNTDDITVQIYLGNRHSRFKLQYGIMKQGLFSG